MLGMLTSCTKEESVQPTVDKNEIQYVFKCRSCLVRFEDDVWNRTNELDRSKDQYLNVYKEMSHTFIHKNPKLTSLRVLFYVSVFQVGWQDVELIVRKGGVEIAHEKFRLGYEGLTDYGLEKSFEIKL